MPSVYPTSCTVTVPPARRNNNSGGGDMGGRGGGRGGGRDGGGRGRGRGFRDALIGRRVRINNGPHRGYMGNVQQATDTHVRVELDANNRVVMVRRDFVAAGDSAAGRSRAAGAGRLAPQTPMHPGIGAVTPHYTPAYESVGAPCSSSAVFPHPSAVLDGLLETAAVLCRNPTPHPVCRLAAAGHRADNGRRIQRGNPLPADVQPHHARHCAVHTRHRGGPRIAGRVHTRHRSVPSISGCVCTRHRQRGRDAGKRADNTRHGGIHGARKQLTRM